MAILFQVTLLFLVAFQWTLSSSHGGKKQHTKEKPLPLTTPEEHEWVDSTNLNSWFHPLDKCLIADTRNISSDLIIKDCEEKVKASNPEVKLLPTRCRLGNTWPSRSAYCDATDISFSNRANFRKILKGYDHPNEMVLKEFFLSLAKGKGILLLIGDSVMQQFYSAIACELEREGVWTDPSQFTNTDETKFVQFDSSSSTSSSSSTTSSSSLPEKAAIQFLPIYHFVDGRYDRKPQAAFTKLKDTLDTLIKDYKEIVIICNMGLHYIDNPSPGFSKKDYSLQMTKFLNYLHIFTSTNAQTNKITIIWRETTAQHFTTSNGFWPGIKYIRNMEMKCQPILNTSIELDWRNREIEEIIRKNHLSTIHVMPWYNVTVPLWSEHPNGHLKDCTHFCWTPMLYQPAFYYLRAVSQLKQDHHHHHYHQEQQHHHALLRR
jgi:hypothetical protein